MDADYLKISPIVTETYFRKQKYIAKYNYCNQSLGN